MLQSDYAAKIIYKPRCKVMLVSICVTVKPGAVQDLTAHRVDPQTLKLTWREPVDMASERELSRLEYNVTFTCFSADCISQVRRIFISFSYMLYLLCVVVLLWTLSLAP